MHAHKDTIGYCKSVGQAKQWMFKVGPYIDTSEDLVYHNSLNLMLSILRPWLGRKP